MNRRLSVKNELLGNGFYLSAAGVVLALGVSATLTPSFAEWVGGLFSNATRRMQWIKDGNGSWFSGTGQSGSDG